jgi:hypothetical protein
MLLLRVLATLLLAPGLVLAADVLTSHNDLSRTGVNADERELTPARVNAQTFGRLWTLYADGQVVAQPLHVSGLAVDTSTNPNAPRVQGTFNAVLMATMHNTVYLYDADRENRGPEGRTVPLWATWLGRPRPGGKDIDMWSTNDPEWGILSTPVIDPTKTLVYVVAWHDDTGEGQNYRYRLHALRLRDGTHATPPVTLDAPGLNARHQKQRPGLLLTGGLLYIAFGGDGSRGLLLVYDAATLTQRAAWAVTPTGSDGGIWQAGQAPAADTHGNVYVMTGNGTFDAHRGGQNYGDSIIRLRLEDDSLVVKDYFTPCNEAHLSERDLDLGSSGPLLVPGTDLIVGGGKQGRLYLLSTRRLGKHAPGSPAGATDCPNPGALQDFKATLGHLHGSPVFWQGPDGARLYVWGENDRLRGYRFANRRLIADTPRLGQYRPPDGMPGGMLSLSSQGSRNGILWAVVPLDGDANRERGVKGIVLALDAQDVSKTLWTSEQAGPRDYPGLFARFVPPTIAGGKVFVATYGDDEPRRVYGGQARPRQFPRRYQVAVYGLLPERPAPIVNQTRDDVTVVRASAAGAVALDTSRCRESIPGSIDCTEELARLAGAPSFHRVVVPLGETFSGCRRLVVTTASKQTALPTALGIGFYSADATAGQYGADQGVFVPASQLKAMGTGTLKNGQPATLHEFVGLVDCALAPDVTASKRFKPYMQFAGGRPRTIYRNWDPIAGNYTIGGQVSQFDRTGQVLR